MRRENPYMRFFCAHCSGARRANSWFRHRHRVKVRRQRFEELKLGEVVPFGNLHQYGILRTFQFVVLLQFLPEPVDLNPDDGIGLGIEVRLPAESLDTNCVLLDFIGVRFKSPGGQKPEQLLKGRCALKGLGSYNPLHLIMAECEGNETRV